MRTFQVLALTALLLVSQRAAAVALEPIDDPLACEPEHGAGEYGWSGILPTGETACLFAQFPSGVNQTTFVRYQGKNVRLRPSATVSQPTKPWESVEAFEAAQFPLKVVVRYRLASDSCVAGEDKCCGQSYEGELEIQAGAGNAKYKVTRWSGS